MSDGAGGDVDAGVLAAEELALREASIRASLAELLAHTRATTPAAPAQSASAESAPEPGAPGTKGQLLVVANRLPITVSTDPVTKYAFKMSSGGLVSALVSVRDKLPFIWIGWLGREIPIEDQPAIRQRLMAEFRCLPVFLSDALAAKFYAGMSNDVLWPLLH